MTPDYRLAYDGTMAGLLTAIFDCYEQKLSVVTIAKTGAAADVFAQEREVVTDVVKARRVWQGLGLKAGRDAQQQFHQCFLSEEEGIERLLLHYAQYIFSGTENAVLNFGHPAILGVAQTARKVWREKHRMEAFVRFRQMKDGMFYAAIEPDYNVLPLILPHFRSRYADQDWLIYDLRRKYGIHYLKETKKAGEILMEWGGEVSDGQPGTLQYDEREELFQVLWKDYFKNTGIPARKNPKLHLRHIPKRYWRHLTEKDPV